MRKLLVIVAIFLVPFMVAAASYADNQYQKLAEAYAVRAQDAFDSGEYDLAVEYTAKAEENAELSRQYVETMLLRSDADTQIRVARNRLVWARSLKADENFPEMYNESMALVEQAQVDRLLLVQRQGVERQAGRDSCRHREEAWLPSNRKTGKQRFKRWYSRGTQP